MKKQAFKRISSAFLAIVTVLVMLPSFALPTSAWSWKDDGKFEVAAYDVPIVEDGAIWVDADLDDKYLSGTKITSYPDEVPYFRGGAYSPLKDAGKGDFIAYIAVDTIGMYVYAEIEDTTIFETTNTNGNDGDCLMLYFDWCTPDIVHPSPEELYAMYQLDGVGWDYKPYKSSYSVSGLQYIGWLSADYNGVVSSSMGFNPHRALGPDANDAVIYDAKLIDGGWACEWFIPWRDDEQKEMIANGEQFHCGIGFQACDDSDIDNLCTPDREENTHLKFDQRKELGLSYWADYSMLADLVFVDATCTNSSGHNYETYKTIAPTCVEKGYTIKKCSYCDKTVNEDYVSKLGHDYKIIKSLAPTCEKYGYVITQCSYCFSSINEAIDMIDHDYIMGYCTMCGKAYNTVKVNSTRALVGQEFDVTVSAVVNEGIWSMAFELPIDTNVFEFVSADTSNSIFSQFAVCNFDETTNSYKFNAYNSSSLDNITKGGELVTLTLRVKDNVKEGEYQLALELLDKHIINVDQEKVSFHAESGMVEVLDHILGDANGDGDITNADALVIFRYIYNDQLYPLAQPLAADANCDGEVTNADVLMIFRYIYNPTLYPITTECKHTFVNTVVSPTVNNQGYTLHVCNKCGYSYKDNYVPALGDDEELSVYDQIGIPEDINYGGDDFTIVHWNEGRSEFFVEDDQYGDPVNDAIYKRNLYTEDILGIEFNFIHNQYEGNAQAQMNLWCDRLQNIMADPSTPVDLFASYSRVLSTATLRGLNQDVSVYDNLDLDKEWWPSKIKDELSIDGKLFTLTGDISTNVLHNMYAIFYNKTMAEAYGLPDMVQLVKDDEWTIDKMIEVTSMGYQDMTADGKTPDDQFGMTFAWWCADALIQGADFKILSAGNIDDIADGTYVKVSDDFFSESFDSFVGKLGKWANTVEVFDDANYRGDANTAFIEARAMFHINTVSAGFNLQNTDIEYGILPAPMREEGQESGYRTCLGNSYTNYGMARNCRDGERAAAVLATLGYYGHELTTPAVFEVTFKGQFSKDPTMIEMFDVIRKGICFDMGILYMRELDSVNDKPTNAIANNIDWLDVKMDVFARKVLNTLVNRFNGKIEAMMETY